MTIIISERNNKIVAENVSLLTTAFQQALGLRFAKEPRPTLFAFKSPKQVKLSMWFVRFSLDVVGMDLDGRVLCMQQNLQPWQTWQTPAKVARVLELPSGKVQECEVQIGDKLLLTTK